MHYVLLFVVSLVSCATIELSPRGRMVRVDQNRPQGCAFLGAFESSSGSGATYSDDVYRAERSLQNKVGAAGGDTLVIVDKGSSPFSVRVMGEGYRCQEAVAH